MLDDQAHCGRGFEINCDNNDHIITNGRSADCSLLERVRSSVAIMGGGIDRPRRFPKKIKDNRANWLVANGSTPLVAT